MPDASNLSLLQALLDSGDRNKAIMLNLLRALPEGGLEVKVTASSPWVAHQFAHIHHERLVSVAEEAPELARDVPEEEWEVGARIHLVDEDRPSSNSLDERLSQPIEAHGLGSHAATIRGAALEWSWHDGDKQMVFIRESDLMARRFGSLEADAGWPARGTR